MHALGPGVDQPGSTGLLAERRDVVRHDLGDVMHASLQAQHLITRSARASLMMPRRDSAALNADGHTHAGDTKTTVNINRRLRIPGTIPGGYPKYPDPLRGVFF